MQNIKLDDHYYILSDTYNPAILFHTTGKTDESGRLVGKKRYYQTYNAAIQEYIHETINDNSVNITSLKQLAQHIDNTIKNLNVTLHDQTLSVVTPDISDQTTVDEETEEDINTPDE